MMALFVFADGKTRLLDIPHANPYYYFPVFRRLRGNYSASAALEDDFHKPTVEQLVLKRVGADKDFVFYEEQ
jgi:hypothetical protein